jgi:hypothetical protein
VTSSVYKFISSGRKPTGTAIEKLLKGVFVLKKGEHAPYIHNLQRLAEML